MTFCCCCTEHHQNSMNKYRAVKCIYFVIHGKNAHTYCINYGPKCKACLLQKLREEHSVSDIWYKDHTES